MHNTPASADSIFFILSPQYCIENLHDRYTLFLECLVVQKWFLEVENHPFLHVGRCICVDVIKKFLDDNGIKYYVDDGNGGEEIVNG